MSVIVTMRAPADTEAFRNFVQANANADLMKRISEDAMSKGAIHHQFAVGDGYIMIIDEWETADAFMGWFKGNEAVEEVMRQSGIQGEPEISIGEAFESTDQF